jgi:ribose-phosphate pyrophosphokinase
MSITKSSHEKKKSTMKNNALILIGNDTSPTLPAAAASRGIGIIPASIDSFASGEPFVELFPNDKENAAANATKLKGKDVIVVQSATDSMTHLLMIVHTLKSYDAGNVTVVMPFAPLMRQDRAFDARFVSLGAAFMASQLKAAGADAIVTLTPHSQAAIKAYRDVFGDAFKVVSSTQLFAPDIQKRFGNTPATLAIGAPDGADKSADEGQRRARRLAKAVFGRDDDEVMFLIAKTHTGVNDTRIIDFKGDVAGKDCVIIDDMIDGGSTMLNAASLLKAKGAKSVTAFASHGILSGNALEKILSARADGQNFSIDRLVLADTLPSVAQKIAALAKTQPKLAARADVIATADLLLQAAENEIARTKSPPVHNIRPLRKKAP